MSMDHAKRLEKLEAAGFTAEEIIYMRAASLVELANEYGLVLTIRTQPRQPLAMGSYDMVVDIRNSNASYRGAA